MASSTAEDNLWSPIFGLYDRERSNAADEQDVIAALQCTGRTAAHARRMVAEHSKDSRVQLSAFKELLEHSISCTLHAGAQAEGELDQAELVKFILGILKQFEKTSTSRGEFKLAAETRNVSRAIRDAEAMRQHDELDQRQAQEKSGLQNQVQIEFGACPSAKAAADQVDEVHINEAIEFNRAWTANMEEFEIRAVELAQELRERQAAALQQQEEQARHDLSQRVKHSKAVLDLVQVQSKLAKAGKYVEAQRCQRKINLLTAQEAEAMQAAVEQGVARKLEVLRASHKLEAEALLTRIERGRHEHRTFWTQHAQRMMQSHRNVITDLSTRQNIQVSRAAVGIRADLRPVVRLREQPRAARSSDARVQRPTSAKFANSLPPPRTRPSKLPPPSSAPTRTLAPLG